MGRLITNCEKILLQIVIGIIHCDKFFTNCDSYYKLQQLLKIATQQYMVT